MREAEKIEQVFDQLFIELAGLSDSVSEFNEIREEYDLRDPAFISEMEALLRRYDDVAASAREKFRKLREELLAALKDSD